MESLLRDAMAKKQSIADAEEKIKENEEQYKACINKVAEDDNGRLVLYYFYKFSCLHNVSNAKGSELEEINAYRNMYLRLIRQYLTLDNIRRIEDYGR